MTKRVDVVIIGAGSAGAAAALLCARRGLRVLCVERRGLSEAGACWVNGVPAWTFDVAGISQPRGDEVLPVGEGFHLMAGYGPMRVVTRGQALHAVDMRALVGRLQREAMQAGAEFVDGVVVFRFDGTCLQTSEGPVWARYVVDASGVAGLNLLEQEAVGREDLCAAAQQVREITDVEGARAFFAEYGVGWGETLCFTGISGGYSVLNLCAYEDAEGARLSILAGGIPALGFRSGRTILEEFVKGQDWIGARVFGGTQAIPLRRPLDCLARGKVALLGDAACQVFSAHGSGVGAGLVAARMLADALASGRGPQDYAVRWQRTWGGVMAASDVLRRFSQTLEVEEIAVMMAAGMLDAETTREVLEQRMPVLNGARLMQSVRAVGRAMGQDVGLSTRLGARMMPVLARAGLVRAVYRRYPARAEDLPGWRVLAQALVSESRFAGAGDPGIAGGIGVR